MIGILAGRLKERYHRPTIIFALTEQGELKGSARSIQNINIRDILAAVASKDSSLILKFGGHAMAAGLTILPENFQAFNLAYVAEVAKFLDQDACIARVMTDGPLSMNYLTMETAQLLQSSGPWGQQFPEPCFDNIFDIIDQRLLGTQHLKLTLSLPQHIESFDGIAFNVDRTQWPNLRIRQARIVYRLDINIYQGRSRLQLMIEALIPLF